MGEAQLQYCQSASCHGCADVKLGLLNTPLEGTREDTIMGSVCPWALGDDIESGVA